MAMAERGYTTTAGATASKIYWYVTHITHQAKKVDRCCGCVCSKWGKVGRQCSTTSSMARLTKTYNTQYNVQTLLCPTCVASHAERTGDDKLVAGYGSASNPILSYSGREPGLSASIHRVRCDFTEAFMTHAATITMILSWVLPTMLTVGAGVIMYHGGYKNAEYYPHFAFGLQSIAESMVTAVTLSITLMLLAPKCARIIGSKVGRLAMLTAVVTVASAAHEPPEYMPTQFDTRDPLLTSTSPHSFQATCMCATLAAAFNGRYTKTIRTAEDNLRGVQCRHQRHICADRNSVT